MENHDDDHNHDEVHAAPTPNGTILINARIHALSPEFEVRRVLPFSRAGQTRRHVGSFVFLDHMGPAELDKPMYVSEHPHIGLATATYLFEGEIRHKDYIGSDQVIREGELNLMTAGEWITHIEEGLTHEIHGLQFWLALPLEEEECAPKFKHYEGDDVPSWSIAKGVKAQLLMGRYQERSAKVDFPARTLFMILDSSTSHRIPLTLDLSERELGLYVAEGTVTIEEHGSLQPGQLLVLDQPADGSHAQLEIELGPGARVAFFGGDPLDKPRLMKWNYVASDQELIDQAEKRWAEYSKTLKT